METILVKLLPAIILLSLDLRIASAFYDPTMQRWLCRDPAGVNGVFANVNEYLSFLNSPLFYMDTVGASPTPIPDPGPSESECSKFPWWGKEVGKTGALDCKPQLTEYGMKMPKVVQDCVLAHEGVHSEQCKKHGKDGYAAMCVIPALHACAEAQAYMKSVDCATDKLQKGGLSEADELALRCYKKAADSSLQSYKKQCESWTRNPVPPPK